jgi:hypothetical protein
MKTLALLLISLSTLASSAFAADASEHACDKLALQTANAIFGPLAPRDLRVLKSTEISWNQGGATGENMDIKVELGGAVKGYVVLNTMGPGDSDDCNVIAVSLQQK